MSIETARTGKQSRYLNDEGRKERTGQPLVRGWIGYFHYANRAEVFDKMQWQMRERVRRWLWKKHAKTEAQYGNAYSNERLHDHYGLVNFPMHTKMANLMKQTEERHSESRMRAIRTSGSIMGSLPGGHWRSRLSSRPGLSLLY